MVLATNRETIAMYSVATKYVGKELLAPLALTIPIHWKITIVAIE